MHLVEQLRIKRTEAQHRLGSRKRKLSELFAATACPALATNDLYIRQLQVFQDANDLQNGHRFDESTLPARFQITFQPRHAQGRAPHASPTKSVKDVGKPNVPYVNDVDAPNATAPDGFRPVGKSSALSHDTNGIHNAHRLSPEHSEDEKDVLDAQSRLASTRSPVDRVVADAPSHSDSPRQSVQDAHPVTSPKSLHKDEQDQRTSTVNDAATANLVEPQSSPASTNEPSTSTPGPTNGSPTTSLGGEEPSLGLIVPDAEKSTEVAAVQNHSQTPEDGATHPIHKMSVSSVDMDIMDTDPSIAFDSPVQSVTPQIQLQRESFSRPKPPIRVNTQHHLGPSPIPQAITSGQFVETPAQMTDTDTPRLTTSITPISAVDSSKRATRISSGALLKKSVSEILGETPKFSSIHGGSPISASTRDVNNFPSSQSRQADRERKEKDRSKLSTVVFAKPQRPATESDTIEVAGNHGLDVEKANFEDRDYLYTLFESKAYSSRQGGSLAHLLQHAHKTVTTADHLVDYEYQAQCRVLKRLYQLQSAERWALRQRKRADEPTRQTSHWDFLLDHARWMRTDFREERKWKLAAARGLAECCAEWVASGPENRKLLQVQIQPRKAHTRFDEPVDIVMDDVAVESSHPTPELLPAGEDESISDDLADPHDISLSTAPAAIFSLGASDFTFVADRTPAFDKLINELPLYEPAKIEPDLAKSNLAEKLDARWKTDIVPVSRFAVEKLKINDYQPPFKRSRYDYNLEASPPRQSTPIPPRESNVGLFMPDNKHIRDRIHPGHSFRPPSEYNMPTQAFFETRTSSQWTQSEDEELRRLVKDYSYNWSLISSCLVPKSLYTSSPDRRTPWECFERWIGLEGMPADMAKTPYFRTYQGRIEAASRHLQTQFEEAQRRAAPNVQIPTRKRTTQPMRVERKRAQRHLAMLDAMRKLAKKRETMRQKQTHSAEVAAMRKATEINQHNKPPLRTPAEFSALKHEREQKLAKQQEIYRQQLIAHQRAASAQQQRGPNGQVNGVANPMSHPATAVRAVQNGMPGPVPNGHLQVPNGVPRPHPAMIGPNGMPMTTGMVGPKGVQAQVQANMRIGMGGSPQQVRMHQEQLMRQAQQNGNHSSPNAPHNNMTNGHSAGFMSDVGSANGQPSPSSAMRGNTGSPRQPGGMGQALSSGHVPVLTQIAANIKQRHPTMNDDEVQRAASQQLTTWQQQATAAAAGSAQRPRGHQAALSAAIGAANAAAAAAANGNFNQGQTMMTNEQLQQYNQRMHLQQAQQHAARGMPGPMPMTGPMSNSPVMNMSRPVSQHNNLQGVSRSATPMDQRSNSTSHMSAGISTNGTSGNTVPANGIPHGQGQHQGQGSPARPTSQQAMQT